MPIDYSFQATPHFRDLTQTGLVLMQQPVVRSLRQLRRLREGAPVIEVPAPAKAAKLFRRSPLPGSLY